MLIKYHDSFEKAYKKRIVVGSRLDEKVEEKIRIFKNNPKHPILRDHVLKGKKRNLRAFCVTSNVRIVYKQIAEDKVLFLDIGTHNQVY